MLTELVSKQPVRGARIIALGEHVDYWDSLGWRDPFSQAAFSARQSAYDQHVFRTGQIYTPQMVVDGRREFVGGSMAAAHRAIADAARDSDGRVQVAVDARVDGDAIAAHVEVMPGGRVSASEPATVFVAVIENGLASDVRRGENGGRVLHHSAVTRLLKSLGTTTGAARWNGDDRLPLDRAWTTGALEIVAFVQDNASLRILGAAVVPLG